MYFTFIICPLGLLLLFIIIHVHLLIQNRETQCVFTHSYLIRQEQSLSYLHLSVLFFSLNLLYFLFISVRNIRSYDITYDVFVWFSTHTHTHAPNMPWKTQWPESKNWPSDVIVIETLYSKKNQLVCTWDEKLIWTLIVNPKYFFILNCYNDNSKWFRNALFLFIVSIGSG